MLNKNKLKLVNFLSLLYNPLKYPIPKSKIQQISDGIFGSKMNTLDNLSFFKEFYFLDPKDDIFSVKSLADAVSATINKWNNSSYAWSLAVNYNKNGDDYQFSLSIEKLLNKKKKNRLRKLIIDEINKIKPKDFTNKKDDRYKLNVKQYNAGGNLIDKYNNLYTYHHTGPFSEEISRLLYVLFIIDRKNWADNIEKLECSFAKYLYNYHYYINCTHKGGNSYINILDFYIKQIDPKASKELISFCCINVLEGLNLLYQQDSSGAHKILNSLIKKLFVLKDRYYWVGLLAVNAEYILHGDKSNQSLINYFNKQIDKTVKKSLLNSTNNNEDLKRLVNGLEQTRRQTYLEHLGSFAKIDVHNHQLSVLMAKTLLNHYKELLIKENFQLSLSMKEDVEYINLLIKTISFLYKHQEVEPIHLFNDLLSPFLPSIKNIKENHTKMILNKRKIIHIFTISFLVLSDIKDKAYLSNHKKDLDLLCDEFINSLYFFSDSFYDNELIIAFYNVFKLKKIINNKLKKDIAINLLKKSHPPFDYIAILVSSFNNNGKNARNITKHMETYFDEYNNLWTDDRGEHKIKRWLNIWRALKDNTRADICQKNLELRRVDRARGI